MFVVGSPITREFSHFMFHFKVRQVTNSFGVHGCEELQGGFVLSIDHGLFTMGA